MRLKKDGTPWGKTGRKPRTPQVPLPDTTKLHEQIVARECDVIAPADRRKHLPDTPNLSQLHADAQFHDIALRILAGQTTLEIATILGLSVRHLRRVIRDPRLQAIYIRERDKHIANVSDALRDEKLPSVIRKKALVTRGQTVIGEVLDTVREQVAQAKEQGVPVKAAILKAGTEAAVAAFNHLDADPAQGGGREGDTNIRIDADKAVLIRTMVKEADIDISDLFDAGAGGNDSNVIDVAATTSEDSDAPS